MSKNKYSNKINIRTGLMLSGYFLVAISTPTLAKSADSLVTSNNATSSISKIENTTETVAIPKPVLAKIYELSFNPSNLSYIITPLRPNKTNKLPTVINTDINVEADSGKDELMAVDKNTVKSALLSPLTTPVSFQSNIPRTPASTMKLIPTFVALDTLGADFYWFTHVYHTGTKIDNTLYGDLIIKASGDPKLTHEDLNQLLFQVQQTGITHINGNIVIDANIFANVDKDPAAFDGKPLRPYNTSPNAFLTNFSTLEVTSYPVNEQTAQLVYTPKLANTVLPNQINIRQAKCDSSLKHTIDPQWKINTRTNQTNTTNTPATLDTLDTLIFNKALPSGCGQRTFYIAYPNPSKFSEKLVAATWQDLGNTLSGMVITRTNLPNKISENYQPSRAIPSKVNSPIPIATHVSNSLSQQINDINHYSNNVMTEQLTLSIATYQQNQPHNNQPKNQHENQNNKTHEQIGYTHALGDIKAWWQANLDSQVPYMTNGSGLCRSCHVTASSLNSLLGLAYKHPDFTTYVNSLGIAGVSGTIYAHKYRLPKSQAIGRAWIKTGTLDNVTAMAGYVKGISGQDYSVVAIINLEETELTNLKKTASYYRPVLDSLIDWTAKH